ncbi:MAG TPA: alpha/beta hydrolase [Paenibacillus sp.]|uniref:alpha/beta fold hydrolase n=1 Tax=Paenibacillus sp. TaxID=58172 RepID=UPI002CFB89BD|nr:alpha/beta hydrolase [Paenibacillus sp.]HUC90537.1 alpha/beta hydrolase [Paenibacillus sp.]
MTYPSNESSTVNGKSVSAMLWLGGWSMPDQVFEPLRSLLPEFRHYSVEYGSADSQAIMLDMIQAAALAARSEPLIVAGWSLGGLAALRLAAEGLADGLVLLASTAKFVRSKAERNLGWPDAFLRHMIHALARDREAVEADFRTKLFTEEERERGLESLIPNTGQWTREALLAGLGLLRDANLLSDLPDIACPALVVHGTDDSVCPYEAALELSDALPQAELLTLHGCGHAPFLGRESVVAEEIRRWRLASFERVDSPKV